jgi:hypothetical protein
VEWFTDPWAYCPSESFVENCFVVHSTLVIGLRDIMSDLLLVTLEREVGQLRDWKVEKGNTSLGVIGARGMRDCGQVAVVGT